jgi:hypothetical protein
VIRRKAQILADHINGTFMIYLRGSRHVPPRAETVADAMSALFELLEREHEPSVRVVLGHWLFGYIHPYPDGNGRIARFLNERDARLGRISLDRYPRRRSRLLFGCLGNGKRSARCQTFRNIHSGTSGLVSKRRKSRRQVANVYARSASTGFEADGAPRCAAKAYQGRAGRSASCPEWRPCRRRKFIMHLQSHNSAQFHPVGRAKMTTMQDETGHSVRRHVCFGRRAPVSRTAGNGQDRRRTRAGIEGLVSAHLCHSPGHKNDPVTQLSPLVLGVHDWQLALLGPSLDLEKQLINPIDYGKMVFDLDDPIG